MDTLNLALKLMGKEKTTEERSEAVNPSTASIIHMIAVTPSSGGKVVLMDEIESSADWTEGDYIEIEEDGTFEEYESEDDPLEDVDDSVVDMTDGDGADIEETDETSSVSFSVADYQAQAAEAYALEAISEEEADATEDDLADENASITDALDDGDATELPDDGETSEEDDLADENASVGESTDDEYTLTDDNSDDESDDYVEGAEVSDGYTVAECIGSINAGDRVAVMVQDGKVVVLGVVGSGDEQRANTESAQLTADEALEQADEAQGRSYEALEQASQAASDATEAQGKANEAAQAAQTATESAAQAQEKANAAHAEVEEVKSNVSSLEKTVTNAKTAADNAQQAATTAQTKAEEAEQAAKDAQEDAEEAKAAADNAQSTANTAVEKADLAQGTAEEAKAEAALAQSTANAAKADAAQAQKDLDEFASELETVSQTMKADYARKTDLTTMQAEMQTQITQNANEISSTAQRITEIDETANNAAEQAAQAQQTAQQAQTQADAATADAEAAQTAANQAKAAADAAQSEADKAKAAADTAQSVADKAETDLEAAKADLATVQGRVDATEEEIAQAEAAVEAAQAAADKAKQDAATATQKATDAQSTADTAVTNAANAQAKANEAATLATNAQAAADKAQGDATEAQTKANEASQAAAAAQSTADTAKTNAANAQAKANEAAQAASAAQQAADDADARAAQAESDLATAKQNLANITSRVDATEDEVEAAQAAVEAAQAAADKAKADALTAQNTANTAKANAATAQQAADNAKSAADTAQNAADQAQAAADKAQADVDSLAVRVTTAETKILQNSEQIALMATKTEVTKTLGGYYTKEQTDAAIKVQSDAITSSVKSTYATKQEVENIEVGGRNLLYGNGLIQIHSNNPDLYPITCEETKENGITFYRVKRTNSSLYPNTLSIFNSIVKESFNYKEMVGQQVTLSFKARASRNIQASFMNYAYSGSTQTNFGKTPETITTEWKTYFVTIDTFPEIADGGGVRWLPYMFALADGEFDTFYLDVRDWKFEKGNKATDWTPAPEDMATDDDINGVHESLNETNENLDSTLERVSTSESVIQQLSDAISMLVIDEEGTSLLEQTGEGWKFNLAATEKAVTDLSDGLNKLQEETGDTQKTVNVLNQAITDANKKLDYVNIGTYENEPCIELGENDSDYKLMVTNKRIMFRVGSNIPTLINTNGLVTKNIEVEGEIIQGGFVQVITDDDGWGLLWKGVSE